MIVRCQKCGHENQHASIFCRKCGVKLDKEQLEAAIFNQKKSNVLHSRIKTIRRIIILAVIVVLLYSVFMILYPSFFPSQKAVLSKEQFREALIKLHSFELRSQKYYTFNPSEVTTLYNKYLMPKKLRKIPLSITIKNNNNISFSFRKKISNTIPIVLEYTVVGTPLFSNIKGKRVLTDIKIAEVKLGRLSLPSALGTYIVNEFKPYYSKKVKGVVKKINRIEIDKDKGFVIYLRTRRVIN